MGAQYTRLGPVRIDDLADGTQGEIIGWSSSGTATAQSREGVRASHGTGQSIPNGVFTEVDYEGEIYDDNGLHDLVTNKGRLTAQVAGRYLVILQIRWDGNATGVRMINILENGSTSRAVEGVAPGSASTFSARMIASVIVNLEANDFVTSEVFQDSGGALNVASTSDDSPRFTMQRLRDQ